MDFHFSAARKIGINIFSSQSLDELCALLTNEFSPDFSGTINVHLTKSLKSAIFFGDQYQTIENLKPNKNTLKWYSRSAIYLQYDNITFSAIKNGFTAISPDERETITAIILLCEKYLAIHPLKGISDSIRLNANYSSLKMVELLDSSLSELEKQFDSLNVKIQTLPNDNHPDTHASIQKFYRLYGEFKGFKNTVNDFSDSAVIEVMKTP